MLLDVIKKFEETIKKETLTCEVIYNSEVDYTETVINSEALSMTVDVIK
jgi:isoleucyl-tRNA synthetase